MAGITRSAQTIVQPTEPAIASDSSGSWTGGAYRTVIDATSVRGKLININNAVSVDNIKITIDGSVTTLSSGDVEFSQLFFDITFNDSLKVEWSMDATGSGTDKEVEVNYSLV